MKKSKMRTQSLFIVFLLTTACLFEIIPIANSTSTTTQERALSFVSNVLPIDMSKYNSTLTQYGQTPAEAEGEPTTELVEYTLEADDSKLIASCSFSDNTFTGCLLMVQSGSIISGKNAKDIVESSKDLLEKYQSYTGSDLTDMINTLSNADSTKNMTTISGNIKLTVLSYTHDSQIDDVIFRWTQTINGADYTSLGITFRNGNFYALRDDRSLYSIGSTDVEITKEQAISLALKYVLNYSYTGITGSDENPEYIQISGFNITEDAITAELNTYPRETSLYPCWTVQLPLAENYPGNVWALQVSMWANSGEVFLCQPLAVGGVLEETAPSQTQETSPSTSEVPINLVILLIATISLIAVATAVLKKRM